MLRNSGDKALILREAVTHDDHSLEVISYSRISLLWLPPRILITTMILRSWPSMHTYRSRIMSSVRKKSSRY